MSLADLNERVNPALGMTCAECQRPGADVRLPHGGHLHSACRDARRQPAERLAAGPRARTSDPDTSREAAVSVARDLTQRQKDVLSVMRRNRHAMTDVSLVALYRAEVARGHLAAQSESGIRTRRHELVEQGHVIDTGIRVPLAGSGRRAIAWRVA